MTTKKSTLRRLATAGAVAMLSIAAVHPTPCFNGDSSVSLTDEVLTARSCDYSEPFTMDISAVVPDSVTSITSYETTLSKAVSVLATESSTKPPKSVGIVWNGVTVSDAGGITITGKMPDNLYFAIFGATGSISAATPFVNLDTSATLGANNTISIVSANLEWASSGSSLVNAAGALNLNSKSFIQITKPTLKGATSALTTGKTDVTGSSGILIDSVTCTACTGPLASTGALTVTDNSIFRVSGSTTDAADAALVKHDGGVGLDTSSIYIIRETSTTGANGKIFDVTGEFTVKGNSVVTILDVEAKATGAAPGSSTQIPTTTEDGSKVYGGGVTIDGSLLGSVSEYGDKGLIITDFVDEKGQNSETSTCQAVSCLPSNQEGAALESTGCQCQCKNSYNKPACLSVNDPLGGLQVACPANCLQCDADGKCLQCAPQYSLNDGECTECKVDNCDFCATVNVCRDCSSGYELLADKATCGTCDRTVVGEGCTVCKSNNVCSACKDSSYKLDVNGVCKQNCQDPNCEKCDLDRTVCTGCTTGYHTVEGVCVKDDENGGNGGNGGSTPSCGIENCFTCSDDQKTCLGCVDGHSPNTAKTMCIEDKDAALPTSTVVSALLISVLSAVAAALL